MNFITINFSHILNQRKANYLSLGQPWVKYRFSKCKKKKYLKRYNGFNLAQLGGFLNHPKVAGSFSFRICMGFNLSYKKKKEKKEKAEKEKKEKKKKEKSCRGWNNDTDNRH